MSVKAFDYAAPASLDEAVLLLSSHADARPLAGGTDLIVQMRSGRRSPSHVVDIKKIPQLSALHFDAAHGLTIGAAVPCHQLRDDAAVKSHFPALAEICSWIGGTPIQGRASLGGNLCNAAPSGDSIPLLIALNASALIYGPSGDRRVPVEQFCIAPGKNILLPGELLVSIHLPVPPAQHGASYLRFIPRNEMDIAVVGAGAAISLDGDRILSAKLALSSVAPTPLLVPAVSELLLDKQPSEALFAEAGELAREAARPISDMRGPAEYRKHLTGVMTRRALTKAWERARGKQ